MKNLTITLSILALGFFALGAGDAEAQYQNPYNYYYGSPAVVYSSYDAAQPYYNYNYGVNTTAYAPTYYGGNMVYGAPAVNTSAYNYYGGNYNYYSGYNQGNNWSGINNHRKNYSYTYQRDIRMRSW